MKRIAVVLMGCALLTLLASEPALAQQATPEAYLELLRSDVRAKRVAILTEGLEMTEWQSERFWPIFREYDNELMALSDRRIALIKEFLETHGTATNDDMADIAKGSFALQSDRLKLRKRYHKKVAKEVGVQVATRFIQVENIVGMMIDLQIADELPLAK